VSLDGLFAGRHFDREIIILCVRWYLRFKLSFRDLVEMMAERGLPLAHTTIMRWVRHYAPEFERRWNRFALTAGTSWRMDETYIKVRGEALVQTESMVEPRDQAVAFLYAASTAFQISGAVLSLSCSLERSNWRL
jgi:transposase-like protein